MKPVNINKKNELKITDLLLEINGGADSHTFIQRWEIRDIAIAATARLESLGLTKAQMVGASAEFFSGDNVPMAYKYKRIVNRVEIERRSSGWFLTLVEKVEIWGNAPKPSYTLTPSQDNAAVTKLRASYTIERLTQKELLNCIDEKIKNLTFLRNTTIRKIKEDDDE